MPQDRVWHGVCEPGVIRYRDDSFRLHALDFPASRGVIRENAILPIDGSPSGYVYADRHAKALHARRTSKHCRRGGQISVRRRPTLVCVAAVGVAPRNVGTLNLGARREDLFSADDVTLFAQAAGQIAIAVDNALSYDASKNSTLSWPRRKSISRTKFAPSIVLEEIIGQSKALKVILKQIETVAPTDSNVLILGETGTGKELVARAIHATQRTPSGYVRQTELRRDSDRAA